MNPIQSRVTPPINRNPLATATVATAAAHFLLPKATSTATATTAAST